MRPPNWKDIVRANGWGTAPDRIRAHQVVIGDCLVVARQKNKQPQIRICVGGHIWTESAQRVIWIEAHGVEGMDALEVRRTCTSARCVRLEHLVAVKREDWSVPQRIRDRMRESSTEWSRSQSLLTPQRLLIIQDRVENGIALHDLAKEWGVCSATIYNAANGFTFRDDGLRISRGKPGRHRRGRGRSLRSVAEMGRS